MSEKLLVADDSPTIQKVVGITLANTDYEVVQALSEAELFGVLDSNSFDLVLLDFNLSEDVDGYELCEKIRESSPNTKLMVMLGTFDSVDDNRLEELGVIEKVIKPFESSKFIQKIKSTLETPLSEINPFDQNFDVESEEDSFDTADLLSDEDDEDWTISGPQIEEDDSDPMPGGNFLEEDEVQENSLVSEVEGWGMSVPEIIGSPVDKSSSLMPPKMNDDDDLSDQLENNPVSYSDEDATGEWSAEELLMKSNEEALPDEDDLDYPLLDESDDNIETSSNLVSLDELNGEISEYDDEEDLEETDPQIIIEKQIDNPDLEKELSEDLSPDEFWAADEGYDADQSGDEDEHTIIIDASDDEESFDVEKHFSIEVGPKLEQDEAHDPIVEALNDLSQHGNEIGPKLEQDSSVSFNKDELILSLKEELKPIIKEMVREAVEEMTRETSEKVAWEVIPDLAENLIRNEVEKLSQKVQQKHSLS
ncbi:MAG: response regulator [Bacteriovoracaceae bacterium]|nr:response regulator [Bacteriovoracaceae bacterium]